MYSRKLRFAMFTLLYFSQGSILGYFAALNALYLRSFDLSMSKIGIFSAIALIPLILKIFLGMLSDRVNLLGQGYRKPYIVIGLLLQAAGQIIFPFIHPAESYQLLITVAFISLTGMALYDTCTDGLALDTTSQEYIGKLQGLMVSGRAMGIVVIAATVGVLSQLTNWRFVFFALAIMTLIPLPLVLFYREPARPPERYFSWQAFRNFKRWPVIALGIFGIISSLVIGGTNQLVNPFLKESYGITFLMAGFFTSVWGAGVILGGITGGRFVDRLGQRKAMLGAILTALLAGLLIAVITGPLSAWPILFVFGLAYGYYETVYFATSMSVTDKRIAASMYAILMALANLGSGIGLALGGRLSDVTGYRSTFLFFALLNLPILLLLNGIFGTKRKSSLK